MQKTHHQDTFLTCEELLKQQAQRAADAKADLNRYIQSVTDPCYKALEAAVTIESELQQLLLDFARRGAKNILETRFQFTPGSETPEDPATAEDALQRSITVNADICTQLQALASNAIPGEEAETLDTLWRDADTLCRRISMIHVTLGDV